MIYTLKLPPVEHKLNIIEGNLSKIAEDLKGRNGNIGGSQL